MDSDNVPIEIKLKTLLKELFYLIRQVDQECQKSTALANIDAVNRLHEKCRNEGKITVQLAAKLRKHYTLTVKDAEAEQKLIKKALEQIEEILKLKSKAAEGKSAKHLRRGVHLSMLNTSAVLLPLWIPQSPNEQPPPLCGALPADSSYLCSAGDQVAARVKSDQPNTIEDDGQGEEENWILAEVVAYHSSTSKYDVDDIDSEEGKQRHTLSRRRIIPLPQFKADPEFFPYALFPRNSLVLALYPQTTCFYRAVVQEPPTNALSGYLVLFEDANYPTGYAPPLQVAQRYVIASKSLKPLNAQTRK